MQIVTTANVRYDVIYEKGDYKIGVKLLMNFTEKKTEPSDSASIMSLCKLLECLNSCLKTSFQCVCMLFWVVVIFLCVRHKSVTIIVIFV